MATCFWLNRRVRAIASRKSGKAITTFMIGTCHEPDMITVSKTPDRQKGQALSKATIPIFKRASKSFLAQTLTGQWRYYDMNGLGIRIMALGPNHLFTPTPPSISDYVDLVWYQLSHLFIHLMV